MTVKELKDALDNMDDDLTVVYSGDWCFASVDNVEVDTALCDESEKHLLHFAGNKAIVDNPEELKSVKVVHLW